MTRAPAFLFPAVILILIAAQACFVAGYVGREHTFYYWDHAMYFGMARGFYETLAQNPTAGWAQFKGSLADSYNLIFALPSLAGFYLFGVSRTVFILANFFVFFLGYELAAACFLASALGFTRRAAVIFSLVASSLIPPLWLPLLEGYPDAGAAGCVVLAVAFGLQGFQPAKPVRRAVVLGLSLGGAVLLRRHFVYPAIAVVLALGLLALWDILRAPGRLRPLVRAALYFGVCGASFAGILFLIAPDFVANALTTDYNALYLSYRRAPVVFLRFVVGGFGIGLLMTGASGLLRLVFLGKAGCRSAFFAALYVVFWFFLWTLGPDQTGHHYMLHALPFALTVGLAGWFIYFENRRNPAKDFIAVVLFLFLGINSAWALWFSPAGVWPNDNGTPGIFSAPRPPVVRADVSEWRRLAGYLRLTTKPGDRIMAVGSSFIFNEDIFSSVFAEDPGAAGMMARFPKTPEIDHEEPAPLDAFASSNVYVVPSPAQYHLDPSGQRVVTAAANQFPPPSGRRSIFAADHETFRLADGVTVKIWRRKPWTPAALHAVFAEIRRDAMADAAFAQDWVVTAMPLRAQTRTDARNLSIAAGLFDAGHKDMQLFFDHPLATGTGRIAFTATGDCGVPGFRLSVVDAAGHAEMEKDFAPIIVPGDVFQSFTVPAGGGDHYLELQTALQPAAFCRAELRDLRIERN